MEVELGLGNPKFPNLTAVLKSSAGQRYLTAMHKTLASIQFSCRCGLSMFTVAMTVDTTTLCESDSMAS